MKLSVTDCTERRAVDYQLDQPVRVRPFGQRARITTLMLRVERETGVPAQVSAWVEDPAGSRWIVLHREDQAEVLDTLKDEPPAPDPGAVLEAAAARMRVLEQRAAPVDSGGLHIAAERLVSAAIGWQTGSLRLPDILAQDEASGDGR